MSRLISLGRVVRGKRQTLHIVVESGFGIRTLCNGSMPADRSFAGRPHQSTCGACRHAHTLTPPAPAPTSVVPTPPTTSADDVPSSDSGRSTLSADDAKVRRCRCCGEWAWHLDLCTVCRTPAAATGRQEVRGA